MLLGLGKTITFGQKRIYPYATGGDYVYLYEEGNKTYRVHEFHTTGTSTLNVEVGGQVEYLVVGGGGGGGRGRGGGGGGGGALYGSTNVSEENITISVGAGGTGAIYSPASGARNGMDSSFNGIVAYGGGFGGFSWSQYTAEVEPDGGTGGAGGGGIGVRNSTPGTGAPGITGQGYAGGAGVSTSSSTTSAGGGGGGAGETGQDASNGVGGNGGSGIEWPTGSGNYYGGGGGGYVESGTPGSGGTGGGGAGAISTNDGANGLTNTGGGGGGGGGSFLSDGGNGGSGIVIVRYVVAEKTLWTPSELSDLSVWLDANDTSFSNNDAVSTWTNKGSGNDTTQSDSSKRPIFKTNLLNGKPGVQFDGSNDCLQITSLPLNTYISVFVVAKTETTGLPFVEHSANTNNTDGIFIYGGTFSTGQVNRGGNKNSTDVATGSTWFGNTPTQACWIINEIPSAGTMFTIWKDGTSQGPFSVVSGNNTAISNSSVTETLNIGARNNGASVLTDGDWHELIIYNTALSTTDRQKLEGYLAHKWGLTDNLPSGHPYKYEPPYKEEPEEIVTDGLVLNLDAGDYASYPRSGTTWYDISGNGNNGTFTNGPTYDSANKGSIVFDGSDDYVSVGNLGSFTSMSICTFMKRDGNQVNYAGLVFSRGTNTTGLGYRGATNQLGYHWNDSSNTWSWASGLVPPDGEWIMAALCVSGSVATMYMCSSSGITSASNTSYTHTSTTVDDLKIGEDESVVRHSKGNVATVQIYNRALSSTEIQQNYDALKGRYGL